LDAWYLMIPGFISFFEQFWVPRKKRLLKERKIVSNGKQGLSCKDKKWIYICRKVQGESFHD